MSKITEIVVRHRFDKSVHGWELLEVLKENGFDGGRVGKSGIAHVMAQANETTHKSISWSSIFQDGFLVRFSQTATGDNFTSSSFGANELDGIYLRVEANRFNEGILSSPKAQRKAFKAIQIVAEKITTILREHEQQKGVEVQPA